MRVAILSYAVVTAIVILAFTLALMCCNEEGPAFKRVVAFLVNIMYVVFGPSLLTFSIMGWSNLMNQQKWCHKRRGGDGDPVILLISTVFSVVVVWVAAMTITKR